MTWFRVNDRHNDHPKVERLEALCAGDGMLFFAARGVWEAAGVYCAANETDGKFSSVRLLRLTPTLSEKQRERIVGVLVESGLWDRVAAPEADYVFHDWSDYQPTKAELEAQRKAKAERQKSWRSKGATSASRGSSVDASTSASRGHSTDTSRDNAPVRAPDGRVGDSSSDSSGSAEGAKHPIELWPLVDLLATESTPPGSVPRIQITVLGTAEGAMQHALDQLAAQKWTREHFVAWAHLARDGEDKWWDGDYTTLTLFGRVTWDAEERGYRCAATGLLRCLEETRKVMPKPKRVETGPKKPAPPSGPAATREQFAAMRAAVKLPKAGTSNA